MHLRQRLSLLAPAAPDRERIPDDRCTSRSSIRHSRPTASAGGVLKTTDRCRRSEAENRAKSVRRSHHPRTAVRARPDRACGHEGWARGAGPVGPPERLELLADFRWTNSSVVGVGAPYTARESYGMLGGDYRRKGPARSGGRKISQTVARASSPRSTVARAELPSPSGAQAGQRLERGMHKRSGITRALDAFEGATNC